MQSLKSRQLGATNWAFIITLILLLVFIWMWFQETDKHDKLVQEKKDAVKARGRYQCGGRQARRHPRRAQRSRGI